MSVSLMVQACGLGAALVALSVIDLRRQVLPDALTFPLLVFGLFVAMTYQPDEVADRLLAVCLGWLGFAMLSAWYRRRRGVEGLGAGDARLLAAAGAWVGPMGLPWVVLLAALGGIAAVAVMRRRQGWETDRRLPFGPFLSAALFAVWLWMSSAPT
jgi:leader peptidase (prepilin peptidase)/N-methyltransferase